MTLFNYWHYIVLFFIFLIFVGGVVSAIKQPKQKLILPMIFSVALISILLATFGIIAVDKYTKKVKLYKLKNKRLLSVEKIVYTGIVKNEGNFDIGEVTLKIKIVNKGHAIGHMKGNSYFKSSGFFDFFSSGTNTLYKTNTITKEFVVAKNLKPGRAKSFRVYFTFPPYFRSVADFASLSAH